MWPWVALLYWVFPISASMAAMSSSMAMGRGSRGEAGFAIISLLRSGDALHDPEEGTRGR
jgi:hypothetical protein